MLHRFKGIFSGAGFYAALGLCLAAAAAGGYFLLQDGGEEVPQQQQAPPAEAAAPAEEAQAPVVETISPEIMEEQTPVSMPEAAVPADDTPVVAEAPHLVVSPLRGEVVTAFSVDELVYNETLADWRTHDGIDISARAGTTVLAASAGTVLTVEDDALMGTCVTIEHSGGYQTTYASLQAQPAVSQGDTVSAGQIIGAVGTTAAAESAQGPHLHFSVTKDGDAVNPEEFLDS